MEKNTKIVMLFGIAGIVLSALISGYFMYGYGMQNAIDNANALLEPYDLIPAGQYNNDIQTIVTKASILAEMSKKLYCMNMELGKVIAERYHSSFDVNCTVAFGEIQGLAMADSMEQQALANGDRNFMLFRFSTGE